MTAPPTRRDDTDETTQTKRDETNETGKAKPTSLAPVPEDLRQVWNADAHEDLPRCLELNEGRRKAATVRLRERSLPDWRAVVKRISASKFCRGQNDRTWVASFDWLLQPDTAVKVLEGKYDDRDVSRGRVEHEYESRSL